MDLNFVGYLTEGDPLLLQMLLTQQAAVAVDDLGAIVRRQSAQQRAVEYVAGIGPDVVQDAVVQQIDRRPVVNADQRAGRVRRERSAGLGEEDVAGQLCKRDDAVANLAVRVEERFA